VAEKRILIAGPKTAERLRSEYDLEVQSSSFVPEGQLFVMKDPFGGAKMVLVPSALPWQLPASSVQANYQRELDRMVEESITRPRTTIIGGVG
jgi:hypothetical protein